MYLLDSECSRTGVGCPFASSSPDHITNQRLGPRHCEEQYISFGIGQLTPSRPRAPLRQLCRYWPNTGSQVRHRHSSGSMVWLIRTRRCGIHNRYHFNSHSFTRVLCCIRSSIRLSGWVTSLSNRKCPIQLPLRNAVRRAGFQQNTEVV